MAAPSGMGEQILAFCEELRREGSAVGTSEIQDAFRALEIVPWTNPVDFKEALATTVAKSPRDREVFDLVFDRFFFRATEEAALRVSGEGQGDAGDADPSGQAQISQEVARFARPRAARPGGPGGDRGRRRIGDERTRPAGDRGLRPTGRELGRGRCRPAADPARTRPQPRPSPRAPTARAASRSTATGWPASSGS